MAISRPNAARKAATNTVKGSNASKSKPGSSSFAEAWVPNPSRSSPPAADRVAQQFQTAPAEGGNGFFGRFFARPTPPDPSGSAKGPRSITVLRQSKSSEQDSAREITAHDGLKGRLTNKSASHLISKHEHELGIDDPLPPNPSQKPTRYKQVRTRINNENKKKFGDILVEILEDPNTKPFPGVRMRGIKGHGYYSKAYGKFGFFVGIHNEDEFKGQIKKAQSFTERQFKILQEENRID